MPIPALIEKGISRSNNPQIPPMSDSGMAEKMIKLYCTELKAKYSNIQMSSKAAGIAMANLDLAL